MRVVVIGTRGSTLALAQTRWVHEQLLEIWPGSELTVKTVRTRGDRGAEFSEQGIFVKELQEALLNREIDIAVHSLKDLPTASPKGIKLVSVPKRADPRDVFIGAESYPSLDSLPAGAVVGTSSVRRRAQILSYRPDLVVKPLRGNVETRLGALSRDEYDGIMLAAAGLIRLELRHLASEWIDPEIILPAPGQGALALEVRSGDDWAEELAYSLNHPITAARVAAERAFLATLGAGCLAPVGALATLAADELKLEGVVAHPEGSELIRGEILGSLAEAQVLGEELAADILAQGGKEYITASRSSQNS